MGAAMNNGYPDDFQSWTEGEKNTFFAEAARRYRETKEHSVPYFTTLENKTPAHLRETFIPAYEQGLRTLTAADLLKIDFPPRERLLSPWLPEKGLAMIFAERGVGKTWVGLNVGYAVASGGSYLNWTSPKPRRVVYVDGEMPAVDLKERLAVIAAGAEKDCSEDMLTFIAADLQRDGLPDLSDPHAQRFYDQYFEAADLIIIDNLSTIARGVRENEADSWGPMQVWLQTQRAASRSVLLIHHAGKGGQQRGTSRKEDILDSVLSLRRPPNYQASEGARFEVHYTKHRGFYGQEAESFEARMVDKEWLTGEILRDDSEASLKAMQAQGYSVRQIADRTGLSKSKVGRKLHGGDFGPS